MCSPTRSSCFVLMKSSNSQAATTSYEEAAATCRAKVSAIVNECTRLNVKYTDRTFNLRDDDALVSLDSYDDPPSSIKGLGGIGSAKRVTDIFEKPAFFIDGVSANDVRQGYVGDCWFIAAIAAMTGQKDLIERVCVARDEKVGVYGFVFFRDGEWISEVVDDHLALKVSDDQKYAADFQLTVRGGVDVWSGGINSDLTYGTDYDILPLSKEYKESLRKGSKSLYFARCKDSNETWLPLLEKAYAKIHGDYQAIEGGFAGEGIEDLTGGISTIITSESVLDKDKLWSELLQANQESGFLFGCGSRNGRDSDPLDEEGFVRGHAYTVLNAREVKDPKDETKTIRLLRVKNPWGNTEWNGAWSDGSKEWTAKMITELDHTFGDDGIFWISYQDWLKYFPDFERTKLFGKEWTVAQHWTTVNVPWRTEYLNDAFSFALAEKSPVVLVLSQPDDRYFSGLRGRYRFELHFRLYKDDDQTYLVRSILGTGSGRSCSAELDLEPGRYLVHVKIDTTRYDYEKTPGEVIKTYRADRRNKLLAVGRNFDLSHSKGRLKEKEESNDADRRATSRREDIDELKRRRGFNKIDRDRERARNKRREAEKKRKLEAKKLDRQREKAEEKAAAAKLAAELATEEAKPDASAEKKTPAPAGSEEKSETKQELLSPPASTTTSSSDSPPQATPDTEASVEQAKQAAGGDAEATTKAESGPTPPEEAAATSTEAPKEDAEPATEAEAPAQEEHESDVSDVSSVEDDDFR